jgi:hypothetical protein
MNTCTQKTSHAIIDSGASCCVTPYIEDFIHKPTPIQNTTLKGIAGGLAALGTGNVQVKINQENKENKENMILIIDNAIYAPDCPIQLVGPQQLHRQSKAKQKDRRTHASRQKKLQQHYFMGGIRSHAPNTQKRKYQCITDKTKKRTYTTSSMSLAQQPSFKGCSRVILNETNNTTAPTAYITNLNTAQQELLRLHESYAHADMKEIQQQIEDCEIKANRQVMICHIPKCLSCCENKGKKRSHKKHRGSITQDDIQPGSNTSIDQVDAAHLETQRITHPEEIQKLRVIH